MVGSPSLFERLRRPKAAASNRDQSFTSEETVVECEDDLEAFGEQHVEKDGAVSFQDLHETPLGRSASAPVVPSIPRYSSPPTGSHHRGSLSRKAGGDTLGLNPVSLPANPTADIIFIHGLGGGAFRSWSWEHDPQRFWPEWLAREPELSSARVHTYGYAAPIFASGNTMTIRDFAKGLHFSMTFGYGDQLSPSIGNLPIIFVTHSMGGLVAKTAYTSGKHDKKFAEIMANVKAMIFFSTPHRGGQGAERLSSVLSAFGLAKDYVRELMSNAAFLQSINDDFTRDCGDLKLFSFYETMKTSIGPRSEVVVSKQSGILNLPNETINPVVADHHSICKFESPLDPRYQDVKNLLLALVGPFQNIWPEAMEVDVTDVPSSLTRLSTALGVDEDATLEDAQRFRVVAKEGTCNWIKSQRWFNEWFEDQIDGPHLLWISGPPAAGKSVLASFVVDLLRSQFGDSACQYHTFGFEDKTKRSTSYLLRSIAYQAARHSPALSTQLLALSDRFGVPFSGMGAPMIWEKIFRGLIFDMLRTKTVYWVLDGLDEADPEAMPLLFQCFRTIEATSRLRILLMSRPTHDLDMRVNQLQIKNSIHHLCEADTYQDIRTVVEDAVSAVLPEQISSRQKVVDKMMQKAAGNFLWAALTTKDLGHHWHRRSDIENALSGFPSEMGPLYARMMDRVCSQVPETGKLAAVLLAWAAYSFTPIHLTELRTALDQEFPDLTSLEHTLRHICGGFVEVRNGRISLVHETARHFLANECQDRSVVMRPAQSHEYLAIACLQYLSSTRERSWRQILQLAEVRKTKSGHSKEIAPFLSYAAKSWAYHTSLASADSPSLHKILSEFFEKDVLTWINALALLGDLRSIIRAGKLLKTFVGNRKKLEMGQTRGSLIDEMDHTKLWAVDLIKLVGKFGSNLLQQPSSIYKMISPFCPENSVLRQTLLRSYETFSVEGVTNVDWDDCTARLSVGAEETASKVIATAETFAALVPQAQSLVVWHAETCEELRRMRHGEYLLTLAVNRRGDLVCTAGFKTIKIWELSTGREVGAIRKHTDDKPLAVGFGSQDDHIWTCYQDQLVVCENWKEKRAVFAFHATAHEELHASRGLKIATFSPDGLKLAIGARSNRPVEIWDLSTGSRIYRCMMEGEAFHADNAVFQEAEVIRFHPYSGNIYVLYHDTTMVDWNPDFDERTSHPIGAKNIVCSPCGNYLLASEVDGAIKVFALPDYSQSRRRRSFAPIYRLENPEFVRDLAFSPDGQRFYELRGSMCTVWEPEVLVAAEKPDTEEDRSLESDSTLAVEIVKSTPAALNQADITALTCAPDDLGFCCGRDDGTLTIYDMGTGKRLRSLPGHARDMSIIALAWAMSSRWIASADDSGHVLVRKIHMGSGTNQRPTVWKPADFRIKDEGIEQLLFSSDDKYLLISTLTSDRIWDVAAKRIIQIRPHSSSKRYRWIEHPADPSRLMSINAGEVHVLNWNNLLSSTPGMGIPFVRTDTTPSPGASETSASANASVDSARGDVTGVTKTRDKRLIFFETTPSNSRKRRRIELIRTEDIDHPDALSATTVSPPIPLRTEITQSLAKEVLKLIGSCHNQVVFFNHAHWVCTWESGTVVSSYKKHFFLPRDWVTAETLELSALGDRGTLLCARNTEVAIIKDGIRL